ncbi:MAG: hypothetical protein ABIK90_07285 [candidate division WOR-3 bacterium]
MFFLIVILFFFLLKQKNIKNNNFSFNQEKKENIISSKKEVNNNLFSNVSSFPTSITPKITSQYKEAKKIPPPSYLLNKRYPFKTEILEKGYHIGKVLVNLEDLEKKFKLYFSDSGRSDINNWEKIASILTEEAILINEGIKEGIIPSSENYIYPPNVNKARDYFETEGTTYISGEVISIWFYNMNPPKMGVETAKKKVYPIINNLRERIINNEITMKQAGEIIAQTEELKEIDPAYKTNAYTNFSYIKPDQQIFNDPHLNQIIWNLNEEELSKILIGKDFSLSNNSWYEAFYVLIKINEKKIKKFENIESLINNRINEGLKIEIKN